MKKLLALPAALVVAAVIASPSVAATPATFQATQAQAAPAPATQGIIMRDGGICAPIRWGC